MTRKLKVLTKISQLLNDANVLWNVGGSVMLYLKNYVDDFNDIDLMVSERDVLMVKKILSELGTLKPERHHEKFGTKYFFSFLIDSIDVDLMAGFSIIYQSKAYYFPLDDTTEIETVLLNGTKISIAALTDWLTFYRLMERTDKVKLIETKMHK